MSLRDDAQLPEDDEDAKIRKIVIATMDFMMNEIKRTLEVERGSAGVNTAAAGVGSVVDLIAALTREVRAGIPTSQRAKSVPSSIPRLGKLGDFPVSRFH